MEIIFKLNGANLLSDNKASFAPGIGWKIKVFNQFYRVVSIFADYDVKEEIIEINVVEWNPNTMTTKKQVICVKIWKQTEGSLTLEKVYNIIREDEQTFTIVNDKGKEKKYFHGNFQFQLVE